MKLIEYKKTINSPLRQSTLCFLLKNNQVLLAMKKRGFGQGRWNGVGGKQHPSETIIETAVRETQEEIGAIPKNLKQLAVLDFYFENNPDWNQQVSVFATNIWEGEITETEEMKPQWFDIDKIPYDSMWPDDPHWLPLVLQGKNVRGEFLFGENDTVLDYIVTEI